MSDQTSENMSDQLYCITANCSFVTSFGSFFKHTASDNLGVIKNLKDMGKGNYDDFLYKVKVKNYNGAYDIVKKLYEKSIDAIVDSINNNNVVVGLQELNYNDFAYETIKSKLPVETVKQSEQSEQSKQSKYFPVFRCMEVGSLYPTLGYILTGSLTDYLDTTNITIPDNKPDYNYKKMAIRDLGSINTIDGVNYFARDINTDGTLKNDNARPISMVVKQVNDSPVNDSPVNDSPVNDSPASFIFINCHMLNPSGLKQYSIKDNVYIENQQMDKNLLNTFCQTRFQTCITEMVDEFKNLIVDDNTVVIFLGDFNDPFGYLKTNQLTCTIKDIEYTMNIHNSMKTCCPNTNSAFTIEITDAKEIAIIPPSNDTIEKIVEDKETLNKKFENYNDFNDPAFFGDYVASDSKNKNITTDEGKLIIGGSDHKFFGINLTIKDKPVTPPEGGKRRRTRRKNKNKNAKKTNKKGKSKKYRKKGRKTRKIRRRK